MEAALCSALALSPNQVFNTNPGDTNFSLKYSKDRSVVMTVAATGILGKSGGLLERPTIETTSPGRESEFDLSYDAFKYIIRSEKEFWGSLRNLETVIPSSRTEVNPLSTLNANYIFEPVHLDAAEKGKSRKTSPPYRVLLHNDNFNKREYVVQVLMKVIPGMTVDNAVNIMQEAHYNGLAVVIICAQVDAEDHCMQLRGNGLLSSIEPADGGC